MLSAPRDQVGSGGPFAGEVVAWQRSVYAGVIASILYNSLDTTRFAVFFCSNALRGVVAVSAMLSFGDVPVVRRLGVDPDQQRADSTAPFLFLIYFWPSLFLGRCTWYHVGVFCIACAAVCVASLPSLSGILP